MSPPSWPRVRSKNERERKLTILMNPFMSCGARLPVYALFAAAFFPTSGQNVVFALYLTGIAVAILTGLMMKKSLLPGSSSGFMMELPPIICRPCAVCCCAPGTGCACSSKRLGG